MNHILSDHARKRMMKRKIRAEWIEITLAHPANEGDVRVCHLGLLIEGRFEDDSVSE